MTNLCQIGSISVRLSHFAPLVPLLFVAQLTALGAVRNPDPSPAAESSIVYTSFFRFHQNLANAASLHKSKNPSQTPSIDQQLARSLSIGVDDLAPLGAVSDKVAATIAAVDAEEVKYRNARAALEQFADLSVLKQNSSKRDAAVAAGIADLARTLTAKGWVGLHSYIDNVYRLNIHIATLQPVSK